MLVDINLKMNYNCVSLVDLMGLLKWRDNPGGLKDHLVSFMKVDGEEVVKVTITKLENR